MVGLTLLAGVYVLSGSSRLQGAVFVGYALIAGAILAITFRRPRRNDYGTTHKPTACKDRPPVSPRLVFILTILAWGMAVYLVVAPAISNTVGGWFCWWLIVSPALELQRLAERGMKGEGPGLPRRGRRTHT